jgi:hypothetical protein
MRPGDGLVISVAPGGECIAAEAMYEDDIRCTRGIVRAGDRMQPAQSSTSFRWRRFSKLMTLWLPLKTLRHAKISHARKLTRLRRIAQQSASDLMLIENLQSR